MIIARMLHESAKGWHAQVFNTENPVLNYTEEEQEKEEQEIGGALRPDELYAQEVYPANKDATEQDAKNAATAKYPYIVFVPSTAFDMAIDDCIEALVRKERAEKVASGWSPFDTGVTCHHCGGKVKWDKNPEFAHPSNAPWGVPVQTWAHCEGCRMTYGEKYEEGLTYLNSNVEPTPRWFYIENGKSFYFDPRVEVE